jgi:PqqD family protein of HPr-rel-A system
MGFARFQIKVYGLEAVVFDTASGDTHYLSPLAYALYLTSHDQPRLNAGEIESAVAIHFDYELDPGFHLLTEDAMTSLHKIGLLQRS